MSKIFTVFGATGNQGGSVIRSILSDPALRREFTIRGITRDSSKPAAKALAEKGVQLRNADLNSKDSVLEAINGSHTVYLVTNFWETMKKDVETTQGRNVADAAKQAGVQHIIFSTLLNVNKETNGRLKHVPHFDGKAEVEEYIRSTGVPCSFMMPGYFMSNYAEMIQKKDDGSLSLTYPVGEKTKFPLFDPEDTGKFVKALVKNRDFFPDNRILAATAYYTPSEVVSQLQEVTGKKATFQQVSGDDYKSFLPSNIADEYYEMHLFIEDPGFYKGASLDKSLAALGDDKPTTWKEFVKKSGAF